MLPFVEHTIITLDDCYQSHPVFVKRTKQLSSFFVDLRNDQDFIHKEFGSFAKKMRRYPLRPERSGFVWRSYRRLWLK